MGPLKTRPRRRVLRVALLALLLVAFALLSMLAGAYVAVARSLPSLELGDRISSPQTTKIYDASPTPILLAELRGLENREVLTGDRIPQVMRDAIVAIEDPEFYSHKNVDFLVILRAAWASVRHREEVPGGSVITQQLVKNGFTTGEGSIDRTVREAALAYGLESRWTKEKILNEYLNAVYFGSGAYGVQAAARIHFGVDAQDLSLAQAALLAGLPKAPSTYSPAGEPEAALARRDLVLNRMYQQRFITSEQLQEALATPLQLAEAESDAGGKAPHWVELVREQLVARYGSSMVLGGGLRVHTSLDLSLQEAAEEAVAAVLDRPGDPSAALVALDVHSGHVVAMVGGNEFEKAEPNLAIEARRNPGSAFSTFALVAALQSGISPETTFDSGPVILELPSGSLAVDSTDQGSITLAKAVAECSDGVFARLGTRLGGSETAKTAAAMGIMSPIADEAASSLALRGVPSGVTPLEMAVAYATLADGGERMYAQLSFDPSKASFPVTIVKVTDAEGKIIDQNSTARVRVIEPGLAALATSCLRRVITEGTGRAAAIGRPAAGKTGTSDDNKDAWFVGYTPDLVAAVWVGYRDGTRSMSMVRTEPVTGETLPAQIWAAFMRTAVAGMPISDFPTLPASRWVTVAVCSESGLAPTDLCPDVVNMLFRSDDTPGDTCNIHVAKSVFMPNVVGMSLSKAKQLLAASNLTVKTVRDNDSLKPAGIVLRQDAPADRPILQGSQVVLHVSAGRATTVPRLVDLPLEQAQALLASAGLTAEIDRQSHPAPAGKVVAQDPAPGSVVSKGSAVRLVVSSGPETPPST